MNHRLLIFALAFIGSAQIASAFGPADLFTAIAIINLLFVGFLGLARHQHWGVFAIPSLTGPERAAARWHSLAEGDDPYLIKAREDYATGKIDMDTLVSRVEFALGFPSKPVPDERPADVRIEAAVKAAMSAPHSNGPASQVVPILTGGNGCIVATNTAVWSATNSIPGTAVGHFPVEETVELVDGTGKVVRTVPVSEARKRYADHEWNRIRGD